MNRSYKRVIVLSVFLALTCLLIGFAAPAYAAVNVAISLQQKPLLAGVAGSTTFNISLGGNWGSPITLTLTTTLPSGATASFSPNPTTKTTGSVLTITTTAATPYGSTTFSVRATEGSNQATANGTLKINQTYTWKEGGHTTPWGTSTNPYSGLTNTKTVYFYGAGYAGATTYQIRYYDSTGAERRSIGKITDANGNLTDDYLLPGDLSSDKAGTWVVKVFLSTTQVAQQNFQVDPSAIPEFPSLAAGLIVPLGCLGVYLALRKNQKKAVAARGPNREGPIT